MGKCCSAGRMTTVSVLIPCYQEQAFIRGCLESVLAFELPSETAFEVLVIDGMSTDGSREIVASLAERDARIRLVDNPGRIQSTGLNIGIALAAGDFIVRLDAHSAYPQDYLRRCLDTAERTKAENVGGLFITQARGEGYQAAVVQALTTHKFGVGDAGFRVNAAEGPADTVAYGCFRRAVFARVGLFDERLVRAQDYEMNRRIARAGGTIWLDPAIRVLYYQQPDLRSFLRKQIAREAPYNAYLWYLAPYAFTPRHAVTALFAIGVLGGIALAPFSIVLRGVFVAIMSLYAGLALLAAAQQAWRYRRLLHLIVLPGCFFLYHFLHGIGVLVGLLRLVFRAAPVQASAEPWVGAGRFRAWPQHADRVIVA
jgi:succinoglycan biosynthesis protein ExoA